MLKIFALKEKVYLNSSYEELTSIYMVLIIVTYKTIRGIGNLFHYFVSCITCNCYMPL